MIARGLMEGVGGVCLCFAQGGVFDDNAFRAWFRKEFDEGELHKDDEERAREEVRRIAHIRCADWFSHTLHGCSNRPVHTTSV